MKSEYILDTMTYINDKYIRNAINRLGYLKEEKKQVTGQMFIFPILRRIAIFIGIVILALSTSVATVMAFNEEFREAVCEIIFEFFHIEQEEVVPELSNDVEITTHNMYVEQERSIIGGLIEGRYVHAPMSCNAREGVYTICTDEIEMKQGSYYDAYYEENGEFVKLEEHTFSGDYTVLGNDFHIEFDWAVHGGQVALTHIGVEENYRIPANPGDADAMLIELLCSFPTEGGDNIGTIYPVLLNLETGELMDVLAGTGAEELMYLANQAISEDLSKMLLAQSEGDLYYVDISGNKLYSVEELSGEPADACSLINNALACWVLEEDGCRAWVIDLVSMERRELFSSIPNMITSKEQNAGIVYLSGFDTAVHWGTMFTGSHFALEVDAVGSVKVIDLVTGERILIEGFTWPDDKYTDILWEPSPDGKRLLLSGGEIGSKYEYIGVLDFEKMSYLEFSRENNNEVHEWRPYWFDKDTVIIPAVSDSYLVQDYYIYDILDEAAIHFSTEEASLDELEMINSEQAD